MLRHRRPVQDIGKRQLGVDRGEPDAVAQQLGDRDAFLAGGSELRQYRATGASRSMRPRSTHMLTQIATASFVVENTSCNVSGRYGAPPGATTPLVRF